MSRHQAEKRVLCVGLCCVDIISILKSFPKEDTDQRSLDYYWQKGGNAANTASVLGLLGANVEYFGTFVQSQEYEFLKKDFQSFDVNIENCVIHEHGVYRSPVSIVLINRENASRTIMAALNHLAELSYDEFDSNIELSDYRWIHFEGRPTIPEIRKMMEKIASYNRRLPETDQITVSLELEKPSRKELETLFPLANVIFVSKEYAQDYGYKNKEVVVDSFLKKCDNRAVIICAWGEDGAAAKSIEQETVTSPIFPPEKLIDTLGAGDTFNAGTIHGLSRGLSLKDAITFGCQVAGAKCGMTSYRGLTMFRDKLL